MSENHKMFQRSSLRCCNVFRGFFPLPPPVLSLFMFQKNDESFKLSKAIHKNTTQLNPKPQHYDPAHTPSTESLCECADDSSLAYSALRHWSRAGSSRRQPVCSSIGAASVSSARSTFALMLHDAAPDATARESPALPACQACRDWRNWRKWCVASVPASSQDLG